MTGWVKAPVDPGVEKPPVDPESAALTASLAALIRTGLDNSERSQQISIGASEAGFGCARRLSYKLAGTAPVNFPDPMKLLVGIGVHLALADIFGRLGSRWLVEHPVSYADIPGTLDLYDQANYDLIDWKTTTKSRLAVYRKDGPPAHYLAQIRLYAAALVQAGYKVKRTAIVFLPVDGTLDDMWAYLSTPDGAGALAVAERLHDLADSDPADIAATPDRYCGWCGSYRPGSTDLDVACPGSATKGKPS